MQSRYLLALLAVWASTAAAADAGKLEDLQVCRARQVELGSKVEAFHGEARIKRLLEADLRRASREETEGDGDECIEALDHAAKLLAGDA